MTTDDKTQGLHDWIECQICGRAAVCTQCGVVEAATDPDTQALVDRLVEERVRGTEVKRPLGGAVLVTWLRAVEHRHALDMPPELRALLGGDDD